MKLDLNSFKATNPETVLQCSPFSPECTTDPKRDTLNKNRREPYEPKVQYRGLGVVGIYVILLFSVFLQIPDLTRDVNRRTVGWTEPGAPSDTRPTRSGEQCGTPLDTNPVRTVPSGRGTHSLSQV